MNDLALTLITGRSTKQGMGISIGKERAEYQEATNIIELSGGDMLRAGLKDGDAVRINSEFGTADAGCRKADIPEGLAFMAFGPACNRLVGGETYASGMPDSKHIKVKVGLLHDAR
jgi:formylmethanofuran dehydrogenase subunit D